MYSGLVFGTCDMFRHVMYTQMTITELFMPSEPPAYETLQLIDTNVTPPYPGLDAELPNYCEIVTDVVHNQVGAF